MQLKLHNYGDVSQRGGLALDVNYCIWIMHAKCGSVIALMVSACSRCLLTKAIELVGGSSLCKGCMDI